MSRSTITRQITTTEENIRRLMESLEEENDTRTDELANCQTKVDKLFGKLNENHTELTSDVKEMLDNFRAGRVSPDELEKLLVGEREKVSYSLHLADNAKKSLDDVMSFVQHFVHDVERGKPVPKDSFTSLYNELDTIAESMNSMAKVHRSKDIQKLKRIMQTHLDEKKSISVDDGVVSLKHILNENNRETKERHQKLSQANNRTSIMPIGSLSKARSGRDLMGGGGGGGDMSSSHRLASPDRRESMASRGGSRSPTNAFERRTNTSGSMGGTLGPTTPGKSGGFGFDKTGQSMMSTDEADVDAPVLSLHGRHSSISKSTKKPKKSGKNEKRLSSAVIYQHTDDDVSVGSSGGVSLSSTGGPLSLAEFMPADARKLQVNQSVQTDDVAIDFNQRSLDGGESSEVEQLSQQEMPDTEGGRQGNKTASSGGKKSAGGKRKKDGKSLPGTISMVSARRGSPEKSRGAPSSVSFGKDTPSSSQRSSGGQGGGTEQQQISPHGGAAAQEYLQNYADKSTTEGSSNESGIVEDGVRSKQEKEDEQMASMSSDQAKQFLNKKEQRLLLLEAKLRKQQEDMEAVIAVKVAEEVAKTQQQNQTTKTKQSSDQEGVSESQERSSSSSEQPEGDGGSSNDEGTGAMSRPVSSDKSRPLVIEEEKKKEKEEGGDEMKGEKEERTEKVSEQQSQSHSQDQPQVDAGAAGAGTAAKKKKTADATTTKPPAGPRSSFTKRGDGKKAEGKKGTKDAKSNNKQPPQPLTLDKLIEQIITFLPRSEQHGDNGNNYTKIPVHNITHSDSMNNSECLKLPLIVDTNPKSSKNERNASSRSKKAGVKGVVETPNMAVSGVRVTAAGGSLVSTENTPAGDNDDMSVMSNGSQESAMQRMSRSPTHPPDLVNEIWIPPPGNLNKKIFNTICIFPLHNVDQATSTDDLNPIEQLPLTMEALPLDEPSGSKGMIGDESPQSQRSPIIPRGLSHVEAISRPSTRGGDNIVISRPITQTGSAAGAAGTSKRGGAPTVTLEDVTTELKKQGATEGNPLLQLYLFFYKDLDVQCRHHLLAAASGVSMDASKYATKQAVKEGAEGREGQGKGKGKGHQGSPYSVASLQGMSDMFEVVAEEVSKLEYTAYYAMQAVWQTEQTINDLIMIATSREELTDSFYFHLRESSTKLGEVKIAEAWVGMLLHDSRAIFSRTRALGIDPVLIGPQFSIAYQSFLSCQGANLALKKKLDEVHALQQKYLAVPIIHAQTRPVVADNGRIQQHCEMLRERCEDLEEAIHDINDENEELRAELQIMDSQLDRTPGALLFFSVLHNPKLPEVIANHIQILLGVKSTLDGTAHFDFMALKRRLELCLHGLPALQQFFKKYASLHKKWAATRAKMFLDRRQIGGDADNHYVCPICNIDSRRAEVDMGCPLVNTAPKNSSSSGALATITKIKTNPVKNKKGGLMSSSLPSPQFGF